MSTFQRVWLRAQLQIAPRKRRRLAVAVWAEHSEILEAPVILYAIDVVDMNRQRASSPFVNAAAIAALG
jgi:hypothetical protein